MFLRKRAPIHKQMKRLSVEIVKKIPNINRGGCGVFTYFMTKRLIEKGYQPIIIVYDQDTEIEIKIEHCNNALQGQDFIPTITSANHFCVEIEGQEYDGAGKYINKYYQYRGQYTLAQLKVALHSGAWNKCYNRELTPLLKTLINEYIS